MKKTLFSFFLLMSALCVSAQIKIVDMTDSSTVHAASVFISGNRCVGVSGADGLLPLPNGYKGKVTVNHINYYEKEFLADTVSSGVVMLKPRAYAIPEVEAKVGEPDYLVISAYCRAYVFTDSVPTSFREGLYDYYLPIGSGRVKCKTRSEKKVHTLDDKYGFSRSFFSWRYMLLENLPKSDIFTDTASDKVVSRGWKGCVLGLKNDTVNKTFTAYCDSAFAGADSLTINIFGYKIRFMGIKEGEVYSTKYGQPKLSNLLRRYCCVNAKGKTPGKNPMTPIDMYEELYVTGVRYATKAERKAAMKDKTAEQLVVPADVPPLSKPLEEAVSQMKP
ncbi:hypothetical protein [Prevotella marseillensis]|uniref:hypothetical protein n=1 Tax=Prevotella marseillensis TaxID=2479840 RepID=UPI000F636EE5|nr:hypothetical protein [Prevotella marseillensis]